MVLDMIQFRSKQVRVFAILILIFLSQEQAFLSISLLMRLSPSGNASTLAPSESDSSSEDVSDEINGKQVAV